VFGIMESIVSMNATMKTSLLLAVLAASIYYYHGSSKPVWTARDTATQPAANHVLGNKIIVAPAPSYSDRWKNACTDLKSGPNAQVTFEPFLPDEQATWNQTPVYTIVSGARIRLH
jgi:hypothetical protein